MSRGSKELAQARRFIREFGKPISTDPSTLINNIRNDIRNVRLPRRNNQDTYHFIKGVLRLYFDGELKTAEKILGLNSALEFIADDAHINEYDKNLNGLHINEIINRFKVVEAINLKEDMIRSQSLKLTKNKDYNIIEIKDYNMAKEYSKYTSWCITSSENMFNSYTGQGLGKFYFVLKNGFENIKRPSSNNNVMDDYGLSMIAVSVKLNGRLNTITSRYNHDCGGNDSFLSVSEIEKLIGQSFYSAFPGRSDKELLSLGFSPKLGKIWKFRNRYTHEIEYGIIVKVKENDVPEYVMGRNWVSNPETNSTCMDWYDAMKYGNVNGWELGSKDFLMDIMRFKDLINENIEQNQMRLNNGETIDDLAINKDDVI